MIINPARLQIAFEESLTALERQDLPDYLKKRWRNALEKAQDRLIEHPVFAWQPDKSIIVSIPKDKKGETSCRFYWASAAECRRIDKSGLCRAFFEGFPCWHRATHLLLEMYFDETTENNPKSSEASNGAENCQLLVST